jgi:protein phosphatase
VNVRPNSAGSVFLICSDGLTDMLDQDAIEASIDADIGVFANTLFNQAMAAGGADNISVCVVQIMREKVEQESYVSQVEAGSD